MSVLLRPLLLLGHDLRRLREHRVRVELRAEVGGAARERRPERGIGGGRGQHELVVGLELGRRLHARGARKLWHCGEQPGRRGGRVLRRRRRVRAGGQEGVGRVEARQEGGGGGGREARVEERVGGRHGGRGHRRVLLLLLARLGAARGLLRDCGLGQLRGRRRRRPEVHEAGGGTERAALVCRLRHGGVYHIHGLSKLALLLLLVGRHALARGLGREAGGRAAGRQFRVRGRRRARP